MSSTAMHKSPKTANKASNPGTGGAVVLLAACRKLEGAAVVALVLATADVVFAAAVVVVAFVVAFVVCCAIDGRLKTSINKSAKTLLKTIFFILVDQLPYTQIATRL
jgi:hypothetical protein